MRELIRNQTRWRVREVPTAHLPGARGDRCLIYESDSVIRRVWSYPDDWTALPEETLWSLVERAGAAPTPKHTEPVPAAPSVSGTSSTDAHGVSELARTLFDGMLSMRDASVAPRQERRRLVDECRRRREEMHAAVKVYAEALRRDGVPPERALVLLKDAVHHGLVGACAEEPVIEELVHDGVEWCIAAYYAA